MYNEFVNGTGCKENDHNYGVYKNLEILYMNSDMSKEEIYEYGKKLVDNSKSQAEIEAENDIKAEIATLKEELESADKERKWWKESRDYWRSQKDDDCEKASFNMLKIYRNDCRRLRNRINELKSLLVA